MNNWLKERLGEGMFVKHGFAFKGEYFTDTGDSIILTPGNFHEKGGFKYTPGKEKYYSGDIPKDYICKKGDLIVAMTEQAAGLLGSTALVPEDSIFLHNQRIGLISFDEKKYDKLFLYYLFQSKYVRKQIANSSTGSKVKHTSPQRIYDVEVFKPSVEIQKKIGIKLASIEAKIELNNKINVELEAMAKLIYDYWFVQFDFPDENGKPYKSSGGLMVYNEELKREIPAGWEVDPFSNWIENDKSGDWGKESLQGNYINMVSCIRGADLNGLNGKGAVKAPTRFILEKNKHKLLELGDFIIEISGGSPTQSTGRMAFITKETLERFENPLICSNFCKAVTLKEKKSMFNFAYEWNRLYDAGVLFGWEGKTSGIKNLLFDSFVTNHKVALPDSKMIEQFYDKAKPIHAQIQKNLQQNQKLAELRDWLLPMLMNGQVKVK